MQKTIHSANYQRLLRQLRRARQTAHLTQAELAERLGATQSFVSKCERGERRIDVVETRAFCQAIGISFRQFIAEFDAAATDRAPTRGKKRRKQRRG
jgi:transcriptional regulator with XRE-family HTH domain